MRDPRPQHPDTLHPQGLLPQLWQQTQVFLRLGAHWGRRGAGNSSDQYPDLPPGVDSMVREEVHRLQTRVDVLEQVRLCWEWLSLVSRPHSL